MRFPDEYIGCQKNTEEAYQKWQAVNDDMCSDEFLEYQKVLRENRKIIESLPLESWGLNHGTLIYVLGDTGIPPQMYRNHWGQLQFHDRKDYWFKEQTLTPYDLVSKLRRGSAIILTEVPVSFDNYEEGL